LKDDPAPTGIVFFSFRMIAMADENTFTDSLRLLAAKGLRYRTVIDLGCADGHFFLQHFSLGLLAGAVPLHVDANSLYEDSLRAIRDTLGGHYVIAAATDHVGETELTIGSHPYWSSLLNRDDAYWQRMNKLHTGKVKVPAVTVDSLSRELNLSPPFLLKLDIQGAERAVLRGARETLKETDVVICEIDLADFHDLDEIMDDAGFSLFDITVLRRMADGSLGWFYPVYLNRRRDGIRNRTLWDPSVNEAVTEMQRKRRLQILEYNAQVLADLRKSRGGA
jgi:FkbM family methyltransferase